MKLLVKFPTRGRSGKVMPLLEKYRDMRSRHHEVYFLVSIDQDDRLMNNTNMVGRIGRLGAGHPGVCPIVKVGNSKTKVQAINADMKSAPPDWDVMVLSSDDMIPQVAGYDAIIFEHLLSHFPDKDGCIWFNDGYTGRKLCTLVVMGRPYYERFNYIYHPDYVSLWCDNEWTEVAQQLDRIRFVDCTIIKHEHWANSASVPKDEVYRHNESFDARDKALYHVRKKQGFWLGKGHSC